MNLDRWFGVGFCSVMLKELRAIITDYAKITPLFSPKLCSAGLEFFDHQDHTLANDLPTRCIRLPPHVPEDEWKWSASAWTIGEMTCRPTEWTVILSYPASCWNPIIRVGIGLFHNRKSLLGADFIQRSVKSDFVGRGDYAVGAQLRPHVHPLHYDKNTDLRADCVLVSGEIWYYEQTTSSGTHFHFKLENDMLTINGKCIFKNIQNIQSLSPFVAIYTPGITASFF